MQLTALTVPPPQLLGTLLVPVRSWPQRASSLQHWHLSCQLGCSPRSFLWPQLKLPQEGDEDAEQNLLSVGSWPWQGLYAPSPELPFRACHSHKGILRPCTSLGCIPWPPSQGEQGWGAAQE